MYLASSSMSTLASSDGGAHAARIADMGEGTRAIHAGLPAPSQGEPFLPGPVFAAPHHMCGEADADQFAYQRHGNPTWTRYERALAELEGGGEVTVFASGMAAAAGVLFSLLGPGQALVAPGDGYPGVRTLARERLEPFGVDVRLVPTDDEQIATAIEGARLVWVETPSNPGLDTCDITALADEVHAAGGLLAVDNTLATPLHQRPLDLGADLSMASGTKYLSGHSDLLMGHVAVRDPLLAEALAGWRTQSGSTPGPFETWLAHRSLATLELRLERQCANAQSVAEMLSKRDDVVALRYPGLPSDPAHAVAAAQMRRFGAVIGLTVGSRSRAERFLAASRLVFEATSFGGVHSTGERRARWGTDAVPEGFIRLSVGCEDLDDLLTDLSGALDVA